MSDRVRWFVAGMLMATLVIGAGIVGAQWSSHSTEAQGTWQVKTVVPPQRTADEMRTPLARPNPDWFIEDWIATLPDSCDIVLTAEEDTVFYRCP